MKTAIKFVSLIRVSTSDQQERQLGLLSQRSNILSYIENLGGELLKEFEEIQSGGFKDTISYGADINLESLLKKRPVLLEALEYAKKHNAVVIIKEISRLTRFSLLFEYLETTKVPFLCTDYPTDNSFMLGLRVKFFEQELLEISKRTKAGLSKSTKPKGTKGADNLAKVDESKRIASIKKKAVDNPNNKRAVGYITTLINGGQSFNAVANTLNAEGFKTARGLEFEATTVKRLYERVA